MVCSAKASCVMPASVQQWMAVAVHAGVEANIDCCGKISPARECIDILASPTGFEPVLSP